MGFVINNSGFTNELKISWTKLGREYLIGAKPNRRQGLIIKKFTLSDVDTNYTIGDQNYIDLTPNVTGEEDNCINGNLVDSQKSLINILENNTFSYNNYIIEFSINSERRDVFSQCVRVNQYELFIDGISIFSSPIPIDIISDKFLDIILYVKPSYLTNFSITNGSISLNNISSNSVVTDNSSDPCNPSINTFITQDTVVIGNPLSSQTISYNTNINNRCVDTVDCSDFYSITALTSTVSLETIWDCNVCEFDNFDDPC